MSVSVVLANITAGESFEAIMAGYHVQRDHIQAALCCAVDLARDRFVPLTERADARDALINAIGN